MQQRSITIDDFASATEKATELLVRELEAGRLDLEVLLHFEAGIEDYLRLRVEEHSRMTSDG